MTRLHCVSWIWIRYFGVLLLSSCAVPEVDDSTTVSEETALQVAHHDNDCWDGDNDDKSSGCDRRVYSPYARPFGKSYSAWSALWWQKVFSLPATGHPLTRGNINGSGNESVNCSAMQASGGQVYFLGGSFLSPTIPVPTPLCPATTLVKRRCHIPRGVSLLIPILNVEQSDVPEDGGVVGTCPQRDAATNTANSIQNPTVSIDGVPITSPFAYRFVSPPFHFKLPSDNLLGTMRHFAHAVGDGYYVMAKPLSRGTHTINFSADVPRFSFCLNVTYTIIVD